MNINTKFFAPATLALALFAAPGIAEAGPEVVVLRPNSNGAAKTHPSPPNSSEKRRCEKTDGARWSSDKRLCIIDAPAVDYSAQLQVNFDQETGGMTVDGNRGAVANFVGSTSMVHHGIDRTMDTADGGLDILGNFLGEYGLFIAIGLMMAMPLRASRGTNWTFGDRTDITHYHSRD